MFIGEYTLNNKWVDIEELIETSMLADTDYFVQNKTSQSVLFLESNNLPDESNNNGYVLLGYKVANLKKGSQKIFVKSKGNDTSRIIITNSI